MPILLSGYLPDEKKQGVSDLLDGQISEHSKRRRPKDIVVVGLLRRQKVTTEEDTDKPPTVTMKFVALEPVTGDDAGEYLEAIERLREIRTGDQALPLEA